MPTVDIINMQGTKVGTLDLADTVFGVEVHEHLYWEVVKSQLACRRAGTHQTLTRTTVSGTTKKVYRQKGTGNARHGSQKGPTIRGGGVAHGPHPRSYFTEPPKKVRRAALRSALSGRLAEGALVVVDTFSMDEIKTSRANKVLDTLQLRNSLLVEATENRNLHLSVRNIPDVKYIRAEGVNVYDVLKYKNLVLTVDSARALEQRLA
jgi:large subunit ribosomal protein L4